MSKQERIFVVVNPTLDEHVALDRAIITAKLLTPSPTVCVFVAIDSDTVDSDVTNDKISRNTDWFEEQIHAPLRAAGLEYKIEVSWCNNWQKAIMRSAEKFGATRILIRAGKPKTPSRFSFAESKWKLLKSANCPVLIVRDGAAEQRRVVLAAVNFQASRDHQQQLNANILTRGRALAESYNAEFHVVNAYIDSMHYPDRGRLAKETGLDSKHIHVVQGYTDEAVATAAKKLSADVVVIGTLGQTGQAKTRRGNTAERVISAVKVDVVVVNSEYES
jgi:universal stress protein E